MTPEEFLPLKHLKRAAWILKVEKVTEIKKSHQSGQSKLTSRRQRQRQKKEGRQTGKTIVYLKELLTSRVGNRVEIKWLQWVLSKREDTPSPPGRVRPPEEESDGLNDTNVCKLFLRNPHLCLSKNNFYVRVYLYWKSGRSVCWGKKQMAATLHQSGTPASNAVECDSMPCPFRRSRFVIMPLLRW